MSVWTARARRGAALLAVCAAAAVLWHAYGPGPGGGPAAFVPSLTRGEALRLTCYAAAGGVGVVTALAPLAGLCLLAFLIPLINSVPLLINSGAPYPVVLFAGIGCLAGWLVNEAVHPRPLEAFRGRFWLVAFGVFLAIGAWASLVRYHPRWQWDMPELLGQPVNVKGMLRGDAVRYIWFVLVNGVLWIALVIATQSILARHRARGTRPGTALIWSLLAGALGAACMAVYQIGLTVNWFGEVYKLVPSHIHFGANTSYYWTRLNRANGTCTDPNALGTLIGLCIPFAAARVVFAGSWTSAGSWIQRCVALAITVIYAFGIQYSGSRSGLLAALLACALTIVVGLVYAADSFLRRRGAPIWSRVLAATVIAGLFAYAFIFLPTLINVADRRLQITQSSSSLARRLKRDFRLFQQRQNIFDMIKDNRRMQYWRYARRIWMEYPLTGIGLGSYVIELPNYCAANREQLFRTDNACNFYLHHAAELGAPALLCVMLFFGAVLYGLLKHGARWSALPRPQKHLRIILTMALPVFLVALFFGVHTLADEVQLAFALLAGLMAVEQQRDEAPWRPGRRGLALIGAGIVLVLAAYTWRCLYHSRRSLNGEHRIAMYAIGQEAGWHQWENWPGDPSRIRWTRRAAVSCVPRESIEVGIPIMSSHPHLAANPVTVSFHLNGRLVRTHTLRTPGEWALITFIVPYADPFVRMDGPRAAIRIEASQTWVPLDVTGEKDLRELGVAVGAFRWRAPDAPSGGFHQEETWSDGTPFRWTGGYAWQKLAIGTNQTVEVPMYASNLLLRRWPLRVALYINRQYLDTVTFRDKRWKNYTYPVAAFAGQNTTGTLEIIPERTWVPRHFGFEDERPLGVAVGTINAR